ncbi:YqzE family protein [Virgibacillus siamensis]|uniref:YqzE family protein n=1 Tax=Virgibacillus siamensis TaxID=480071 RepID=UPI00098487AD|nr:YqzE family protein [Virgibacillus siamensis]
MKGNEYIKFMTQEFTSFIDSTPEERKTRRSQRKSEPAVYSSKWLGMLPFALKSTLKKDSS